MKKNYIKIILDIIMTLLLFLMYSKNVISLNFHEVGGLALFGIFLIHCLFNRKWIAGVTGRLSDKTLPAKTKLGYIVDVLLFITMTFIIISGIFISKVVFTGLSSGGIVWKAGHYFASAVAIILVGIHLGLHWSFIRSMAARLLKLPRAAARPLAIVCIAAVLTYGGYSAATSSFTRWLTMPFSIMADQGGGLPQKGERPEGIKPYGERPEGLGGADNRGKRPEGAPGNSSFDPGRVLNVIASYGSITSIFAALTIMIEKLMKKRKMPYRVKAS